MKKKKISVKHDSGKPRLDLNKLVNSSKMWVFVSLDKNGLHFHSSLEEEGIVLIALTLSSNDEMWKVVKEYVEKLKLTKHNRYN